MCIRRIVQVQFLEKNDIQFFDLNFPIKYVVKTKQTKNPIFLPLVLKTVYSNTRKILKMSEVNVIVL